MKNMRLEAEGITPHLYDINTVAERLSVSPKTIRRLITERRVPFYRVRGSIRLSDEQIDAIVEYCPNMEEILSDFLER